MLDGMSRYRRVARISQKADPDHERLVSPTLMTVLVTVVQVVVTIVVVLLLFDVFEA